MKRKSADIDVHMSVVYLAALSKVCVKRASLTQFSYSTKSIS